MRLCAKAREHGLELRPRMNDGPVCDAHRRWGGVYG